MEEVYVPVSMQNQNYIFTIKFWTINFKLLKKMSNFQWDEYRWKWKKQNDLEVWSELALIWSKLTSFVLCCSAVRMQLRCILCLGTMWQYWRARILPMLSTGRWQILMLLIQSTTILRNVSCSYAARVLALPDLLTCLWGSVVTIIVTNLSKSVEVHVSFVCSAATGCIWYWFFILVYAALCRW